MTFFQKLAGGVAAAVVLTLVGCSGETPAETSLTLTFVKPTDGQTLLASDNENTASAEYQKTIEVKAADTGGKAVTLDTATLELKQADGSFAAVTVTPTVSGNTVDWAKVTLPASTATLRATVTEKSTKRTATATITVSIQLPRPSVLSVSVQGDANDDFKLNATELPSGPPVLNITTTGLADGNTIVVNDSTGTALGQTTSVNNAGTVTLTSLASATEADYPLQIVVTNALSQTNNLGAAQPGYPTNTAAIFTLRIDRVAPTLAVTHPANNAVIGAAMDADSGTAGFQLAISGTTSADVGAGGIEVSLAPTGTKTNLDAANSAFTGNVTVPGEGTYTFTLVPIDTSGNRGTAVMLTETFDFTPPALSAFTCSQQAPTASGFIFVSTSNIHLQGTTPQPGYVADLQAGGNAQILCLITIDGDLNGYFEVTYNGASLFRIFESQNHEVIALPLTLPQGVNSNMLLTATDAAGNVFTITTPAVVDVQPPALPTLTATLVSPGSASLQRSYGLNLAWTAVGDDGTTGTVSGYDVRYRPTALFDEDPTSPNNLVLLGIHDDDSFFNARSIQVGGTVMTSSTLSLPSTGTNGLTGLPAWSDFSIVVRGVDDVGNYSVFTTDTRVTAEQSESSGSLVFANPQGSSSNARFGWNLASGDFNGDGVSDVAVGQPFDKDVNNNSVASHVFVGYGQSDLTSSLTDVQTLTEPETTTIERYGRDISAGNVGDGTGGAADDLLVSAYLLNSLEGRALLYFGNHGSNLGTTLSTTTPTVVDFRGENTSDLLGYTAKMVRDFGSLGAGAGNDGLSEVVLSSPDYASGVGRVYLFWSRPETNWLGTATGAAAPSNTTGSIGAAGTWVVSASTADLIFAGPGTTCPSTSSTPCFGFGTNHGVVNVGDVLPVGGLDGVPDFAIPFSNDEVNQLFIYSGASLRALAKGSVVATTQASVILTQAVTDPTATPPAGSVNGFGAEVSLGAKVFGLGGTGNPVPGLFVTLPLTGQLFVYANYSRSTSTAAQTLEPYLTHNRYLGNTLATGDLDGDGNTDVVLGENVATPGSSAWVVFNNGSSTAPYDPIVGNGTHQARVHGARSLGESVVVGDFNGDGKLDFVAGDPENPGQPGEVRFFY